MVVKQKKKKKKNTKNGEFLNKLKNALRVFWRDG